MEVKAKEINFILELQEGQRDSSDVNTENTDVLNKAGKIGLKRMMRLLDWRILNVKSGLCSLLINFWIRILLKDNEKSRFN